MFIRILAIIFLLIPAAVNAGNMNNFMIYEKPQPIDLEFLDENGGKHTTAEFKGKLVLLNFWATWCKPCLSEMKIFSQMQEEYKKQNKDILIIPISMDFNKAQAVKDFFQEQNITNLPVYIAGDAGIFKKVGIAGLPTCLIIGRDGMERVRIVGASDWEGAEERKFLEGYLAE